LGYTRQAVALLGPQLDLRVTDLDNREFGRYKKTVQRHQEKSQKYVECHVVGIVSRNCAKNRKNRVTNVKWPYFLRSVVIVSKPEDRMPRFFIELSPTLPDHCWFVKPFFQKNSEINLLTTFSIQPSQV
jgi:hypothetical protein